MRRRVPQQLGMFGPTVRLSARRGLNSTSNDQPGGKRGVLELLVRLDASSACSVRASFILCLNFPDLSGMRVRGFNSCTDLWVQMSLAAVQDQ